MSKRASEHNSSSRNDDTKATMAVAAAPRSTRTHRNNKVLLRWHLFTKAVHGIASHFLLDRALTLRPGCAQFFCSQFCPALFPWNTSCCDRWMVNQCFWSLDCHFLSSVSTAEAIGLPPKQLAAGKRDGIHSYLINHSNGQNGIGAGYQLISILPLPFWFTQTNTHTPEQNFLPVSHIEHVWSGDTVIGNSDCVNGNSRRFHMKSFLPDLRRCQSNKLAVWHCLPCSCLSMRSSGVPLAVKCRNFGQACSPKKNKDRIVHIFINNPATKE